MKRTALFIQLFIVAFAGKTQNLDSILAQPQTVELSISTPQPRLKETFQITLDVHHLRANIFRSLASQVQLAEEYAGSSDNGLLRMNVTALKKGKNEIGPLTFTFDQTRYTTNKIAYEVIDPLPNTDQGLWFRAVRTSDTTFCVIIEQRIPASPKTEQSGNSIKISTEPQYTEMAKFRDSYSITGAHGGNSHSETNFSRVIIDGKERQYMYGYSVYFFEVTERSAPIKITKDKLENIPGDYKFEELIIQ